MAAEVAEREPSARRISAEELQALVAGRMAPGDVAIVMLHVGDCQRAASGCSRPASTTPRCMPTRPDRPTPPWSLGQPPNKPTPRPPPAMPKRRFTIGRPSHASKYSFLSPPAGRRRVGPPGPYRILRVLGEGGMGTVFEAEDPQLRRRVAIKVLRARARPTRSRQRFLQEAQFAASLASERIVTIHHVGEDRGCPVHRHGAAGRRIARRAG